MKRIGTLLSVVAALILSACAGPITSDCAKNSICPILIYEKFPGYFGTYPDTVMVQSGGGPQTLIWTFADASKYKFVASTDTLRGDGVELIDANGSKIGMTSCFVTMRSRPDFKPAPEGPYYRCEIARGSKFDVQRYIVRFRAMDGSPRTVDPGVGATGTGHDDDEEDGNYPALPLFNAGDNVVLPDKTAGIDGFRVIWDSAAGALFKRTDAPMVFKDTATPPKEVDVQPCTPSTSADGKKAAPSGRYYTCIFTASLKPLTMTYDARYTDSASAVQTRTGNVTRP